jgi:hypothetical protein
MPTTKHELLDWLMDVPEDAEIGTDGDGLALLAILWHQRSPVRGRSHSQCGRTLC